MPAVDSLVPSSQPARQRMAPAAMPKLGAPAFPQKAIGSAIVQLIINTTGSVMGGLVVAAVTGATMCIVM